MKSTTLSSVWYKFHCCRYNCSCLAEVDDILQSDLFLLLRFCWNDQIYISSVDNDEGSVDVAGLVAMGCHSSFHHSAALLDNGSRKRQ
jgi:hypothetical protein